MFNSTYAVYELNKGIYKTLRKNLILHATLQYGNMVFTKGKHLKFKLPKFLDKNVAD